MATPKSSKNVLLRSKHKQAQELLRENRLPEAKALLERVAQTNRSDYASWEMLADVNYRLRQIDDVIACYQQLALLRPDDLATRISLAALWEMQGRFAEAQQCYQASIRLAPRGPEDHYNLGNAYKGLHRFADAARHYQEALQRLPHLAEAQLNLGICRQQLGQRDQAIADFKKTIAMRPDWAEPCCNLGALLSDIGRHEEALQCCRDALRRHPANAPLHLVLGEVLSKLQRWQEAEDALRKATVLTPDFADAWSSLAELLATQDKKEEAIRCSERALQINPGHLQTWNVLSRIFKGEADPSGLVEHYRRTIDRNPHDAVLHSNMLLQLHYVPTLGADNLFAEHEQWGQRHAPAAVASVTHPNTRDPQRRLRVGYVSPDFRAHSVSYFIEPILSNHDRERIETFCYATVKTEDAVTERLKTLAHHWRDIAELTDAQAVEKIHADQIDILVDLAGHTGMNRLSVFARQPAPVQVTYLGYPGTTGLAAIQYRLTDSIGDVAGQEKYYTEKLVRLPAGFLCYQPPRDAPEVSALPATQAGHVTLGSFNTVAKINTDVIDTWARILHAAPSLRLLLKNAAFQDTVARQHYLELFRERGISESRIELVGHLQARVEHLALYRGIDLALDTFPYNGATTTCEALWMGVPVITLAGQHHAARVGMSLLQQVGLLELVAPTAEEYIQIAVDLAGDLDRLAALRAGMRERLRASPLCDGKRFTGQLEAAYREMWRNWCGDPGLD